MELRPCHATVRPKPTLSNHPTRDTSRAMRENRRGWWLVSLENRQDSHRPRTV